MGSGQLIFNPIRQLVKFANGYWVIYMMSLTF